jgi:quinol monooxygenase YgiN
MDSTYGVSLATCSIDMRFAPKDVDRAVQLLLSVTGHTQAKRGCRACRVGMEAAEKGLVHYREEWDSENAFQRHVQSEEFRRVLVAMDLCCEEPQIVIGNLSGHRGMEYLRQLREKEVTTAE